MYRVLAVFEAVDRVSNVAAKIGSNMDTLGGKLTRIGQDMIATGGQLTRALTVPILGAAAAVTKLGSDFETSMTVVRTMTGSSAEDFALYTAKVQELTGVLPQSANTMAKALYFVASAGFRGQEAIDVLTVSGKAAANSLANIETVAKSVTAALSAYGLQGSDAGRITDVLTMAVIEGSAEFEDFAGSLGKVLPIAAQAGVSFEEVMASMATMTRTGMLASEAGIYLRQALMNLYAPSKQASDILEELGLSADALRESIREQGLLATLAMLMDLTGGQVEKLDALIPNVRGLVAVLATAGTQADTYAEILDKVSNSLGVTDEAFQATSETARVQFALLRNSLEGVALSVAEVLLPRLVDLAGRFREWVDTMRETDPEVLNLIVTVGGLAAAAGPLLIVLGSLITALGTLGTILGTLLPFAPVIAAVVALGGALLYLRQEAQETQARLAEQQRLLQEQKWALLETASSATDYAEKVLEASGATERLSRVTGMGADGTRLLADEMRRLEGEYKRWIAVHESTLNIAEAGFNRLAESTDVATAAAYKFGDAMMQIPRTVEPVSANMSEFVERLRLGSLATKSFATLTGEAFRQIENQIAASLSDVEQTMTGHYRKLVDMQSGYQLDALRAQAEYEAERMVALASGNLDAINELDRSFQEQQILRDLNHKIALAQQQTFYQAELQAQKTAFLDKMTFWLLENKEKLGINLDTIGAILQGLAKGLAVEVSMHAAAALEVVRITEEEAQGVIRSQQEIVDAIAKSMQAILASVEATAQVSAQAFGFDPSVLQADIEEAYRKIALLSSQGLDQVGTTTRQKAGEVIADIASLLDRMFSDIASIMETLSAELPSIPELTVQKWLDQLVNVSRGLVAWVDTHAPGLREFLARFKSEYLPLLQDWSDVTGVAGDLFSRLKSMADAGTTKVGQAKVAVGALFNRALDVMEAAIDWANLNSGRADFAIAAFEKMKDKFQHWSDVLEPFDSLVSRMRSISGALSEKLEDAKTSVSDMFNRTLDLMEAAADWANLNSGRADFAIAALERMGDELIRWANSLEPLETIFSRARAVVEGIEYEAAEVQERSWRAFDRVLTLMEEVADYADLNETRIANAIASLEKWRDLLEDWKDSLDLAGGIISAARTVVEGVGEKAGDLLLDIGFAFDVALNVMEVTAAYVERNEGWIRGVIASIERWRDLLTDWKDSLDLAGGIISAATSVVQGVSEKVGDLKLAVSDAFDTALDVMEIVADYAEQNQGRIRTAIALIEGWRDLLTDWKDSLDLAGGIVSGATTVAEGVGEKIGELKLAISDAFDLALDVMEAVPDYVEQNQDRIMAAIAAIEAWRDLLTGWKDSLDLVTPILSAAQSALQPLSEKLGTIKTTVTMLFEGAIALMEEAVAYLQTNEERVRAAVAGLLAYKELLEGWADALDLVTGVFDRGLSILKAMGEKIPESQMALADFFERVKKLCDDAVKWLDKNAEAVDETTTALLAHRPRLINLASALEPVGDLINTIIDMSRSFNEGDLEQAFNQRLIPAIKNLRLGLQSLHDELIQMDLSFLTDIDTRVGQLRSTLVSVLDTIASMTRAKGTELGGESIIDEFTRALRTGMETAALILTQFHIFLSETFRGWLAKVSLFNEGYAIGKSLADGLWAALPLVIAAAQALADAAGGGIGDKIKEDLEIGSPSQVLRRLGQMAAQGFNLGVIETMTKMFAGFQPQLVPVAVGVGAVGGGGTVPAAPSPAITQHQETHLHVGVLVADEAGLDELERRLRPLREREDTRRGS